jgi:hypothetical protein
MWNEKRHRSSRNSKKIRPSATLPTRNHTWIDLESNLGLQSGKPATNQLSCVTQLDCLKSLVSFLKKRTLTLLPCFPPSRQLYFTQNDSNPILSITKQLRRFSESTNKQMSPLLCRLLFELYTSVRAGEHQRNWQPQRNRNFRETSPI